MGNNFSEQDSLKLINEMITQARNNFQKGAADSSIFCGYFVAATAFLNFALIHLLDDPHQSFWVWLLMIPMIVISKIIDRKKSKEAMVKTHMDTVVGNIWTAYAISTIVFLASIFGTAIAIKSSYLGIMITPVILTMMGTAQYATAIVCRFKTYIYGAIVFWCGALLCTGSYFIGGGDLQFIILGVCAILGLCIPGHILNRKAKENV